jgi:hypothetical protein
MMQAVNALVGAVFVLLASYAAGALLLQSLKIQLARYEKPPLAFVLGASVLHLAIFLVLAAQIGYWPVLIAVPLAFIVAAARKKALGLGEHSAERLPAPLRMVWGSVFTIFTILYFFNALAPEGSPDGSSYHLGFVNQYMRAHGFPHITTNLYASLSQGVEMLFLPAFVIGRHSAGALVHYGFLLALTFAIFAFGRRLGKPWVGAAASLFVYASPVVGIDGTSAYNDLGVAAAVFGCFYFLWIWDQEQSSPLLVPVALLAGYSYAAKYTAFVILPFALIWVLFRARKLRPVLTVAALSLTMVAPWMIKNWVEVANPMAPFLNRYFRNPNVHVEFEQEYSRLLSTYGVENKWTLPLEVTVRGEKTAGLVGPIFLLVPLALFALRFRAGRGLVAAGIVMLGPYLLNVGTRFVIPSLPFFALAICLALSSFPMVLAILIVLHGLASWPGNIHYYSSRYVWHLDGIPFKAALRKIPQDEYLRKISNGYGVAKMIEFYVPKGERVLGLNGIAESYTTRDYLVSFQAAFNESLTDTLNMGWIAEHQPTVLRLLKFPPRQTSQVRLTQTGQGVPLEDWNIHEVRFYSGGQEIPRSPKWRLTAFPNPWEIQFAFDNSPATRWRSWERAFPGMYVEVNFGAPVSIDEIHIETSPDFANVKIRTEVSDNSGNLVKLGDDYANSVLPVKANIRRAATWEMHLRGVNYLLIGDGDWGSEDIRDDPAGWGLKQIAASYGARLYQVLPLEASRR